MRNWGAYIKNLRKCGADEKIVTILEQIKDMHRNPVIHPERRLDNDEALSLVGIVESAISAMVRDMKMRKLGPPLPLPAPPLNSSIGPSGSGTASEMTIELRPSFTAMVIASIPKLRAAS